MSSDAEQRCRALQRTGRIPKPSFWSALIEPESRMSYRYS